VSEWPDRHASSPLELQARLAAERATAPFIELRDGEGVQQLVPLTEEELTIGRTPASGLALTWDAQVSRSHATLEAIDGVWTVLDDGRSTNGTFVNEERVTGRRALHHLDVIRTGATRLRFHDPREASDLKLTEVASEAVAPPLTTAPRARLAVPLCGRAGDQRRDRPGADGVGRHGQDAYARAVRRVPPRCRAAVSQALRARAARDRLRARAST
jgi:hypothetical protein